MLVPVAYILLYIFLLIYCRGFLSASSRLHEYHIHTCSDTMVMAAVRARARRSDKKAKKREKESQSD